jgi:hypothetical protein
MSINDDEYFAAVDVGDFNDDAEFLPFNPRERDDESDFSSVSTNRKRQRKIAAEFKNIDKGYHKLNRIINRKNVEIDVYSTNDMPGSMIRDAVTGSRYSQFRVGTPNEHLFFKAKIATGEINGDSLLFFDSPEQYERHFKGVCVVDQIIKEKWTNKCAEIRARNLRE